MNVGDRVQSTQHSFLTGTVVKVTLMPFANPQVDFMNEVVYVDWDDENYRDYTAFVNSDESLIRMVSSKMEIAEVREA